MVKIKVVAYVEKIVPVEVEIDNKWKSMEEYGNTSWMELTREQDDYFEENHEEFYTDVCEALEKIGESGHDLHSISTAMGSIIMDDLHEY